MRIIGLTLSLLLVVLTPLTAAFAQRGPTADSWELLGQQTVGFRVDNDSINVNQDEEWFRNRAFKALRFAVERNDVNLISIRITYINGHTEELQVGKNIRRGGELVVDLRGERSFLKQIDMRYRANLGISGGGINLNQAVVKVYGERVQRRPGPPVAPPVVAGPGWSDIDTKRFNLSADRVVLSTERGDGRFGRIKLKSLGEPVRVRNISVRFRNGETQSVPVDSRLDRGEETRAIDLEGETRFVDSVTVTLDPRRRPGTGELQLVGSRRPGGEPEAPAGDRYTTRGWVQLGQQTVGFGVDRDVIKIGQSEEWFRNRGFRVLHFIAERNDINMISARIVYLNGFAEDFKIDRLIPAGSDVAVDLRGERSYISQIEMTYRSRPSFKGQAVMKVYGEPVRR